MAMKRVEITANLDSAFGVSSTIRGHEVMIDQPVETGGKNQGINPLEALFFSFAGCLCAIARIISMQRQIPLRGMQVTVSGELNMDGLMGLDPDCEIGFTAIEVVANIDAGMTQEEKEAFFEEVEHRCPVSENLIKLTKVTALVAG